jgi:hypothetical protein
MRSQAELGNETEVPSRSSSVVSPDTCTESLMFIRLASAVLAFMHCFAILPSVDAQDRASSQPSSPALPLVGSDVQRGLDALESELAALLREVRVVRAQLARLPKRPLPVDAYPLNLGNAEALRVAHDVLAGRRTVTVSSDELVYYGGGIAARPKDLLHTTITVNWKMIAQEMSAEQAVEQAIPAIQRRARALSKP